MSSMVVLIQSCIQSALLLQETVTVSLKGETNDLLPSLTWPRLLIQCGWIASSFSFMNLVWGVRPSNFCIGSTKVFDAVPCCTAGNCLTKCPSTPWNADSRFCLSLPVSHRIDVWDALCICSMRGVYPVLSHSDHSYVQSRIHLTPLVPLNCK